MTFPSRESVAIDPARLGLFVALFAAALLRFWALPHGVPFSVQIDEPEVMVRAVRMMRTGDLNPHFFDYPTLYMYVQACVAVIRFLVGAMQGQWAALAQAPPEAFYVWGRAVTAIAGTATVWILYHAAMRWGSRTALLAAVMFAVMPLHVRESHFVLTDVPMTFFVVLTLLLSLRAHERAGAAAFALAGVAAGLAAATKYNGALAVLLPLICCLMTPAARPSRAIAGLCVFAGMFGAFLAVAPYTLIDLPLFLNQFARLSGEYRTAIPPEPVWQIYLKHLRNALGWPGSVIIMAGLVLGVLNAAVGPSRLKWVVVILFPLAYFRFISNQNLVFGRYLMPLLPFLSLLGAAAVVAAADQARHLRFRPLVRNAIIAVLTLIAIVPPAYTSIGFNATAAKVWTTEQAYYWILEQVPKGSKVTMESRQLLLPEDRFRVAYVARLRLRSFESYVADGTDYLVASSQFYGPYLDTQNGGPVNFPDEYADYMRIFRQTEELARFTPTTDHPGPELRVLRVIR